MKRILQTILDFNRKAKSVDRVNLNITIKNTKSFEYAYLIKVDKEMVIFSSNREIVCVRLEDINYIVYDKYHEELHNKIMELVGDLAPFS